MELPKDFYKLVENPGYLKNIVYGDSVAEYCKTIVKINNETKYLTFGEIWALFEKDKSECDEKEHIINPDIEVLSYNTKNDKLIMTKPYRLIRHFIDKKILRLNLTNYEFIDVTKDHSLIDFDGKNWITTSPEKATYLPAIETKFNNIQNYEIDSNVLKIFKEKLVFNVKPVKIYSKEELNYKGYVYDWEIPETNNFNVNGVIVHNTDSLFIVIPSQVKDLSVEEKNDLASKVSKDINDRITDFLKSNYFKRANISPDYNFTDFKTEMIIESIMFIPDVKKNYAYKSIIENGKLKEIPEIKYKGIQVVKIDASKLSQNLLKEMIQNIILNIDIKKEDKLKHIAKAVDDTNSIFQNCIENAIFEDIGIACKWSKSKSTINSMKLYNFIMEENVFNLGSAGRFIYTKFGNLDYFKKLDIDVSKLNAVCIPFSYSPEKVKEKFKQYGIIIDRAKQWERVFTTTCQRLVDLVKMEAKNA